MYNININNGMSINYNNNIKVNVNQDELQIVNNKIEFAFNVIQST